MFFRRRRESTSQPPTPATAPNPTSASSPTGTTGEGALLAQTIATYFEGGRAVDNVADIGLGGVQIVCSVHEVKPLGSQLIAALYLWLSGGPLGETPIFTSVSGYHEDRLVAIVSGARGWAGSFAPVLKIALAAPASRTDVAQLPLTLQGRRYRLTLAGMDRAHVLEEDPGARILATRERLGGNPWLTPVALSSDQLPLLPAARHTMLSVFVSDGPHGRSAEVRFNGRICKPPANALVEAEPATDGRMVLLRELAVLTALEPAGALERPVVQRTLKGLKRLDQPGQAAGWPGWNAHHGVLGAVLSAEQVDAIENQTGPLPEEFRQFLMDVAGPGAGPGYGLLTPQRVDNVIPLAHGGCGVTWVMWLEPDYAGQIWLDARAHSGTLILVAGSFTEWYRSWLDDAPHHLEPWIQWDGEACEAASALARAARQAARQPAREGKPDRTDPARLTGRVRPGGITIRSPGGYVPQGIAVDPCQACVALAFGFGLEPTVFAPGALSHREGPVELPTEMSTEPAPDVAP